MPNILLDRYLNGEHREAWRDMLALGPAVRDAVHYGHAKQVADETMKRARHNTELIIPKLDALGYKFTSPIDELDEFEAWDVACDRGRAAFRDRVGPIVGQIDAGLGNAAAVAIARALSDGESFWERQEFREERRAPRIAKIHALEEEFRREHGNKPSLEIPTVFIPATQEDVDLIDAIEYVIDGPLPMSVRSWYEQVGMVNLSGKHESIRPAYDDPLPLMMFHLKETAELMLDDHGSGRQLLLWAAEGDAWGVEVPSPDADAVVDPWKRTPLVDHLRTAFEWGGFPGWSHSTDRRPKEIDYLREGLLLI
jgi:hypothetical protein